MSYECFFIIQETFFTRQLLQLLCHFILTFFFRWPALNHFGSIMVYLGSLRTLWFCFFLFF